MLFQRVGLLQQNSIRGPRTKTSLFGKGGERGFDFHVVIMWR
jgi:hypothetical protein